MADKDKREYDYEGDMAMSQLRSIIRNAQMMHDKLEPNSNLPEWVQSKITLAQDYIETAANYLSAEMDEAVKEPTGDLKDACWKGYTAVGFKKKNGRRVPNCVPVKEEAEEHRKQVDERAGAIRAISPVLSLGKAVGRLALGTASIVSPNEKNKQKMNEGIGTAIAQGAASAAAEMIVKKMLSTKKEKKQTMEEEAEDKSSKKLGKVSRLPKGSAKKFQVFVKNAKGNTVSVKFGDPGLEIKRDDPGRRKNFRARHNCDTDPKAKDRTRPKYWSCRQWRASSKVEA